MQRIIGTPTPQPLIPTPLVAPTPKAAPAPSPAPTTTPTPAPATAPTTLAKPEATVVEESIKTAKPMALASLFGAVKETGVDITSDIPASSEPATDLKDSQSKLSKAFGTYKQKIREKLSAAGPTDGQPPKALSLMGRLFDASASMKEKILGLAFRQFGVKEFSHENMKFLDGLMGLSELEPGSEAQDQAIDHLFNKFIKSGAAEEINIDFGTRDRTTERYDDFSAAKSAYVENPSEENLTKLNLARSEMIIKLDNLHASIVLFIKKDTATRFPASTLMKDTQDFIDGKISVSKDKSLSKAWYIQEQLDLTIQHSLETSDKVKRFGFKTEDDVKNKISEIKSQISALRYGSSTTDKIKHKVGMASEKVLSPEQRAQLQSLEKDLKDIDIAMIHLHRSVKQRGEELENHFKIFKTIQTQLADPGFLTQLKTEPLE
jgi:hypothetical protein